MENTLFYCIIVFDNEIIFSLLASDDPPRPTFDSLLSRDMAGYMPARADFIEVNVTNRIVGYGQQNVLFTNPHQYMPCYVW